MYRVFALIIGMLISLAPNAARAAAMAPGFELNDAMGQTVRFDPADRQRPALILFWATWCGYCKVLMPEIQQIRDRFAPDQLDIYAISVWEDGDPIGFMKEHGFTYTLLLEGEAVAAEYRLRGTPGLILTDRAGEVVYVKPDGADAQMTRLAVEHLIEQMSDRGKT